jgi:SP family myo-inositol transporter-like MFS transporter 13
MMLVGVALVDKKGRKFLLKIGTGGVIIALTAAGLAFLEFESKRVDIREKVQAAVSGGGLTLPVNEATLGPAVGGRPMALTVFYSYGGGDKVTQCGAMIQTLSSKSRRIRRPQTDRSLSNAPCMAPCPQRERAGSSRRACASSLRFFRPDRPLSPGSLFPS